MDISYLGHASFKLKGKKASLVTDPYNPDKVGLKFPKHTAADIITISHDHDDHNFSKIVEGTEGTPTPIIFKGPGEYESHGVEIIGVPTFHDDKNGNLRGKNTLYIIEMDGLSLVHCGDLGHTLTDLQADQIENVDILFIPVGGYYTLDAQAAAKVVAYLEPKIVIPMHYNRKELFQDAFANLAELSVFLKEMGAEGVTPQAKLTVTKDKLPAELQVVVLE